MTTILENVRPVQRQEAHVAIDRKMLEDIVSGFAPDSHGLSRAWEEFYIACQAAETSHVLLRAIHDIKESIEDSEHPL
jgi:hypothetical protein